MGRTHAVAAVLLAVLPLASVLGAVAAPAKPVAIPELGRWEAQMVRFGRAQCEYLAQPHTADELLGAVYYDAVRVFLQIADYTRDAAWTACAQRARTIYRDRYVLVHNGKVPGYWNFTRGLAMDYLRTGDEASKKAVLLLSENAAYASDSTELAATRSAVRSREIAYAILSYLDAEKVGARRRARLSPLVDQALDHLDQWFGSKTYRCPRDCDPPAAAGRYYIQPFMVALTAEALIAHAETADDPRILPAIKTALDWLWANAWVAADEAFWYDNHVADPAQPWPARAGSPDLNLVIAPIYGWMYRQTAEAAYRQRGDQIFAGGVKRAYLGGGKQFDQNYRTSFEYVRLRAGAARAPLAGRRDAAAAR
jgi:hypothetical protein